MCYVIDDDDDDDDDDDEVVEEEKMYDDDDDDHTIDNDSNCNFKYGMKIVKKTSSIHGDLILSPLIMFLICSLSIVEHGIV